MPNYRATFSNIVELVCAESCDMCVFCTTQKSIEEIMDCLSEQAPKVLNVNRMRWQMINNALKFLNHNQVNRAIAELESLKDWRTCLKAHHHGGHSNEEHAHTIPKQRHEGRYKQK